MTRLRGDEGVAAVEMAVVLSLFMLMGFGAVPLWRMGSAHQTVSRVAAETLRYATAVSANGSRPAGGGAIRRRPTAAEVTAFARQAAGDSSLAVTTLVCPGDVNTACAPGDPSSAQSGDGVTVIVSATVDLSAAGAVANAVGGLFGSGDIAPRGATTLTSTVHGREE